MKEKLARNISIYRKERGLTQEELAQILGLSFQAVSKWENAQTMPDISLLPQLSRTLEVNIDKLLGYISQDRPISIYEKEYKTQEYYWGTEPNKVCYQVLQFMPPTKHLKLLDIGCGEGKMQCFLQEMDMMSLHLTLTRLSGTLVSCLHTITTGLLKTIQKLFSTALLQVFLTNMQ